MFKFFCQTQHLLGCSLTLKVSNIYWVLFDQNKDFTVCPVNCYLKENGVKVASGLK